MKELISKYRIGELVVYQGLIGEIVAISPVFSYDFLLLSLVSTEDPEMTCTAKESECKPYNEETFDEDASLIALSDAILLGQTMTNLVGGITDKHFRDGNH